MKIPVLPTDSMYRLPGFAHSGDAGADLTAAESMVIGPGERALVPTGFSLAIPEGHAGLVMPRSGLAIRAGVTVIPAWKLEAYLRTLEDSLTTPLGSAVRGEDFQAERIPGPPPPFLKCRPEQTNYR